MELKLRSLRDLRTQKGCVNCTLLELKLRQVLRKEYLQYGVNCTLVELKQKPADVGNLELSEC